MTRRNVLGIVFTLPAAAQEWKSGKEIKEGDTAIQLLRWPEVNSQFSVGVRTGIDADCVLVQVFYPAQFEGETILLSEQHIAPIAGNAAYGASDLFKAVSVDEIRFIRVKFFKVVGEREFRAAK